MKKTNQKMSMVGVYMPQSFIDYLHRYCLAFNCTQSDVLRKQLRMWKQEEWEEEAIENAIMQRLRSDWQSFRIKGGADFGKFRTKVLKKHNQKQHKELMRHYLSILEEEI